MTEYITKEQAIEAMEQVTQPECFIDDTRKDFAKIIEELPAADVAPVVHGRWVWRSPSELPELLDRTRVIYCVKSRFLNTTGIGTGWWRMDGYIEDAHGGRYAIDHPLLYGWMLAPEPLTERMG